VILVIVFAGRPDAVRRPSGPQAPEQQIANPERVREYQERLRALEDGRSAAQPDTAAATQRGAVGGDGRTYAPPAIPQTEDPLAADRKRRDYESLFSTNVVLSRRPESERPATSVGARNGSPATATTSPDAPPSIDDIADAVIRATTRVGTAVSDGARQPGAATAPPAVTARTQTGAARGSKDPTGPIAGSDPVHRLLEGTLIDTVLTNRLDGASTGPLNCLVTNSVYSHNGQHVLIPAGARVLGEAKAVQSLGESRLAVAFHRLVMPDGSTYPLDDFLGANQIGDSGLRDQVNHH
jgi:type IV secretion system protein VirB10